MSEGLLTDSPATEEQPAEAPVSEFANPDFEAEDNQSEVSSDDGEQPESTETVDPNSADSPEGGLRLADYTRKTQDLADQRRQLEAEYQQRIETSQAQMQEQLNQQKELITALKPESDDLIGRALQNPDLTQEDRIGLSVIQGVQQENTTLKAELQQLKEAVATLLPVVEQTQASTQQMTAAQTEAQSKAINEELKASDEAYGAEKTDAAGDPIRALWGKPNPLTQKPYTIPEIVAMAHGLPAKAQEEAVTKQNGHRKAAKKKVRTQSNTAQTPQEGSLSPQEAISAIAETM